MYPTIAPNYEIAETVSHPLEQIRVIGFIGRNTRLGRAAVVMNEESVEDNSVIVPTDPVELLGDEDSELVVLREDSVLAMDGSDFDMEGQTKTMKGGDRTADVTEVSLDSEKFRTFPKNAVPITN